MRELVLTVIVSIIFSIVIIYIFSIRRGKTRKIFEKLSNYLSGSLSNPNFILAPLFKGEYEGLKFSIFVSPYNEVKLGYLEISLIKDSSSKILNMNIYKKSFLDRFKEKLGVAHKLKIDDEMFDREFLTSSEESTRAINYLNNESTKNMIRELFNTGFHSLLIKGTEIVIRRDIYDLAANLEPTKVENILQKLTLLAKEL